MLEHTQSSNGKIFFPEVKSYSTEELENIHRKNNYRKTVDISQIKIAIQVRLRRCAILREKKKAIHRERTLKGNNLFIIVKVNFDS